MNEHLLTRAQMKLIRDLGKETRESMDELHAKITSPGQRFHTLMKTSHTKAAQLGYGGDLDEWVAFVKRS